MITRGEISGVSGNFPNQSPTAYASLATNIAGGIYSYAPHGGIQHMTLGALTEQTCYNTLLQPAGIRLGGGATASCTEHFRYGRSQSCLQLCGGEQRESAIADDRAAGIDMDAELYAV